MTRFLFLIPIFLFVGTISFAQTAETIEMADVMRSNGKIYVVVGVIAIVFTGLIIYLISIDRKVSKLEKKFNNKIAE